MTDEKGGQGFKPLALEDLAPKVMDVTVTTPSGRVAELPLCLLTWHEWNDIGAEVTEPSKSDRKYWTRINPTTKEKEFNPDDVAYLAALEHTTLQRNGRRLLRALEKGGNDVRRGKTVEEEVDNLVGTLGIDLAVALINLLTNLSLGGRANALTRADTFRSE